MGDSSTVRPRAGMPFVEPEKDTAVAGEKQYAAAAKPLQRMVKRVLDLGERWRGWCCCHR
ncbi:MAG TPA: hypothetical protein VFJ52_07815 [Terriglobia bacterium]|nr:hypothetical protein [Terriglobia bacterium]